MCLTSYIQIKSFDICFVALNMPRKYICQTTVLHLLKVIYSFPEPFSFKVRFPSVCLLSVLSPIAGQSMPAVMDEVHLLMTTLKWMTTHGMRAGRCVSGGYLNRAMWKWTTFIFRAGGLEHREDIQKCQSNKTLRGKLYTASRLYLSVSQCKMDVQIPQ